MTSYSNVSGTGLADSLMSAVKKNPEGLLLLAAGCALLLRKGNRSGGQGSSRYSSYPAGWRDTDVRAQRGSVSGPGREIPERISRAADDAREYASNVSNTVTEYASNVGGAVTEKARAYASAAGDYADDARQAIMDRSGRIMEQTQSTMERIVREQPLAIAIAGLAAGAAVASAFPATRMERETIGQAGRRLSEAASEAGEKLSEATSAAGERLISAAQERGVSADGLKEVAKDVAGTFQKSLSGDQQQDRSAANQHRGSSVGGTGQQSAGSLGTGSATTPGQSSSSPTQSSNPSFGSGASRSDPKPTPGRR